MHDRTASVCIAALTGAGATDMCLYIYIASETTAVAWTGFERLRSCFGSQHDWRAVLLEKKSWEMSERAMIKFN